MEETFQALKAFFDAEMKKAQEEARRAREETEEVQAKLESLESACKVPEVAWELLCKAEGSEEVVRAKRIRCQWAGEGKFCDSFAEKALPRPEIFVCPEHRAYWELKVEEARRENKRARVVDE
jgi:hypothetical protein